MAESSPDAAPPPEMPTEIPTEQKKRPWMKILVVVVVIAVIVSAFAVWFFVYRGVSVQSVSLAGESVQNVNEPVSFTAAIDGPISSVEWAFGDGATASTATGTVTHTYALKGTYLLLVTVKGPGGQVATNDGLGLLQVGITDPNQNLANESAVAIAFASPNSITPASSTVLDGNSSYGFDWNAANFAANRFPFFSPQRAKIANWSWDFADGSAVTTGNRSVASKLTHTFSTAGLYAVTLSAQSSSGLWDKSVVTVRVATTTGVIKNPNTFVVGSIGDPQYLDPAIDYETTGGEYIKNVYDRLVTRAVDLTDPANPGLNSSKFVGMAAESWTKSSDGYWWNFTIRQGVKFSDGTPLTAYDVEYSFRRVLIENRGPAWILDQSMTAYASTSDVSARWAAINESVKATDQYHVTFHLAMPYGAFLQTLDFEVSSIVSKAWVEAHGGVAWRARNQFVERNMMGSGPFMLDHWTPGVEFKLVANPNYWGAPQPKLAAVLYKIVLDPATQELLIKNGDIDRAQGIPQKDIDMVDAYPGVNVAKDPSLTVQYLGFSINNTWPGDPTRLVNTSPFRDVHVRRAMSMVVDYNYIQTTILAGYGYQLKSPVPDGMPGYTGQWWTYGTGALADRITAAKAEMALADPSLRGGFDSEMWYNTGNPTREQISVLIQAEAKVLNINLTIRAVSWPQLLSANDFRQAPMFILAWAPDYLDPDDYVFPLVHYSQSPQYIEGTGNPGESTAGTAAACYQNATVDQLIEEAQVETDPATRMQMYSDIQKAFVQDAAWIFLYQPVALNPMRDWVKGWYYDPMALWDFQTVYKQA